MAKAPFYAKDGIKTSELNVTTDIALESSAALTGKSNTGQKVNLIQTSNTNVVVGEHTGATHIYSKDYMYHSPSAGVNHKVYTEDFKPNSLDISNKAPAALNADANKVWIKHNGPATDGLPVFSTVANLSHDSSHGMQFATSYSPDDDQLWFRSRSDNSAAPNGAGLQPWHRVYHDGYRPTVDDLDAAPIEGPVFRNTITKPVVFQRLTSSAESMSISVDDTVVTNHYNNDETSGTQLWRITNSGVEGGNQAQANDAEMRFSSTTAGATLTINDNKVYHEGFKPTAADVDALPITGGLVTGQLTIGSSKTKIFKSDLYDMNIESAANIHIAADTDKQSSTEFVSIKAGNNELKVGSTSGGGTDAKKLTYNGFKVYHEGNKPSAGELAGVLPLSGGTLTGDLTINKVSPVIVLHDSDIVKGTQPAIKFTTANNQGIDITYKEHDDELAQSGYAIRIQRSTDNIQSYPAHLEVEGPVYELNNKRVYSEGHKPTPDEIGALGKTANAVSANNWKHVRKLTLSGDTTGNVSFDGSGDMALSVTVKDNSHAHTIGNVTGLQTALNGKLGKTEKAANANMLDGKDSTYFYSPGNKPSARELGATGMNGTPFNLHEFPASDSNYAPYGSKWAHAGSMKGMVLNLIKQNTVGMTSTSYAGLLTLHPWSDSSGGGATQFMTSGRHLYLRGGTSGSGWDANWAKVYTTLDKPTLADVGGINKATTDSLYLPKTSNAVSASKLKNSRVITTSGDVSGNVAFDGTKNVTLSLAVKNDSHLHSHSTVSGAARTENGLTRLLFPHGASYRASSDSVTGAVKIRLPNSWSNTMLSMKVIIYDYTMNEPCELLLSGYTDNNIDAWVNTGAVVTGSLNNRRFKVRFGHDGTKCCIFIGDVTQTWAYPQIAVTELVAGHSQSAESQWDDGWVVSTVTGLPGNIDKTHTATLPVAEGALSAAKWSTPRKITLTGGATGNVTLDGSGNVDLPVTIASHTHSNYLGKTEKAANADKLDDRDSTGYEKIDTVVSHSLTPGKWYRIASGTARLNAEFTVMDGVAGVHGYTRFQAGASYGNAPFINVMNSTRHGSSGVIGKVRLVTNAADVTYGEVSLEVYCENAGVITSCMTNDIAPHNGWVLRSTVTDQTAMTDNVRATVDIKNNFGIQSNHRMVSAGGYVYSTTDKPTAADVGALGKTEKADDAAKLSGRYAATNATASTITERDSSGDIRVRLVRSEYQNQNTISGAMAFRINNSSDNYIRFCSDKSKIRGFLDVPTTGQLVTTAGNATTALNTANTAKALVDNVYTKAEVDAKVATGVQYEWQFPTLLNGVRRDNNAEGIKWKFLDHNTIICCGIARASHRNWEGVIAFNFPASVRARIGHIQYGQAQNGFGASIQGTLVRTGALYCEVTPTTGSFGFSGYSSGEAPWVMFSMTIALDQ